MSKINMNSSDSGSGSMNATLLNLVQAKSLLTLSLVTLVFGLCYKVFITILWTYSLRQRLTNIPALPRHWLYGNLVNAGQHLDPSLNRHPDYGIEEIWAELDHPAVFLMDLAPVDIPILVITEPSIAEQLVHSSPEFKYSVPKSDTMKALTRLTGEDSLLMVEGEVWKNLRRRFNKGFAPAHLNTLRPLVVSKVAIFVERLKRAAEVGTAFPLKNLAEDLTTDIITNVVLEKDFGTQTTPDGEGAKSRFGILTAVRRSASLVYKVGQGFHLTTYFDPVRPVKSWFYERIVNRELDRLIQESLRKEEQCISANDDKSKKTTKSIVQLALDGLTPTPQLIANTRSQIKTFLFAGEDTTASTIQWLAFELSKVAHSETHAAALHALCAEHNAVFGPGPFSALDTLASPAAADTILGDKLPYTTVFIKELLRVHPPAATARFHQPEPSQPALEIEMPDYGRVNLDGIRLYPSHWIMQRNPSVWGPRASQFDPSRWLNPEYVAKLPVGAWRAFERGPRNCIGQELAIMELKVVLCAVARGFVFEKVGLTGRNGEREVHNVHRVTSIPSDGMVVRVRLRREDEKEF